MEHVRRDPALGNIAGGTIVVLLFSLRTGGMLIRTLPGEKRTGRSLAHEAKT
jgi:hypothetical protein